MKKLTTLLLVTLLLFLAGCSSEKKQKIEEFTDVVYFMDNIDKFKEVNTPELWKEMEGSSFTTDDTKEVIMLTFSSDTTGKWTSKWSDGSSKTNDFTIVGGNKIIEVPNETWTNLYHVTKIADGKYLLESDRKNDQGGGYHNFQLLLKID